MGDAKASGERFFPPREERTILDDVIEDFPFPLALTYSRLQQEMDRQEPVAAAWQLRDAFEVAIKFSASIAVADALASGKDADLAGQLAGILLTPQGLSLGHWHGMLETALEPLKPFIKNDRPQDAGRLLPDLFSVFYETTGRMRRNAVGHSIIDGADGFVPWRNRVFGHGVFREERSWYSHETNRMLDSLHALYQALRPVLSGWSMVGLEPNGEEIPWQGAHELPFVDRHVHEPAEDAMPMALVERDGARRLPLTPLLSIQRCSVCRQPAAFFFDRQKKRDRTILLEYARGHHHDLSGWAAIARLQELVPARFEWKRDSYDSTEIAADEAIAFRDFEHEFARPGYLLDAIWAAVDAEPSGYVHLVGPEGTGKTWLVQGIGADARDHKAVVLPYHIRSGALTDAITFLNELHLVASHALTGRTPSPQLLVSSIDELRQQFVEYLAELIRANNLETLVIAIDALDELCDPPAGAASIADLLPEPSQLPEGCWFLLTNREALRPAVRAGLDRLYGAMTTIHLDPAAAANRSLLRSYLETALAPEFREPQHVDTVLGRSGGVFLYAYHLAHALAAGVFTATATLPNADEFYPAYLGHIRDRVGETLFEDAYLQPLIFLAVAQEPVTFEQLVQWGVPRDRLRVALFDLRDFLRVQRVPGWHDSLNRDGDARYTLAHEAFGRYVQTDPMLAEQARAAHAQIANQALARFDGRWHDTDPCDDADLYILSHLSSHLRDTSIEPIGFDEEAFAAACFVAANTALENVRHVIAERLYDEAIGIYRELVAEGRPELANDLAGALVNRGVALVGLGRLPDAVAAYDEAIMIRRELVAGGRAELANELAMTLVNRGTALDHLGRLPEAVAAYDEAIELRRGLVAGGRAELAHELAMTLVNRGIVLRPLGRLDEVGEAYDEAIGLFRGLVADGRTELANDLARALVNWGIVLRPLGRLAEAVAAFDEAIGIYRELVAGGRTELANDLAMALVNKAIALKRMDRVDDALPLYDEAIALFEGACRSGMSQLLPMLLTTTRYRAMTLRDLGRWPDVTQDVARFFEHAAPALGKDGTNDRIRDETGAMLDMLRALEEADREAVLTTLGKWEATVRSLLEGKSS